MFNLENGNCTMCALNFKVISHCVIYLVYQQCDGIVFKGKHEFKFLVKIGMRLYCSKQIEIMAKKFLFDKMLWPKLCEIKFFLFTAKESHEVQSIFGKISLRHNCLKLVGKIVSIKCLLFV